MPVQIQIRKLKEDAKLPMSGSSQAAGYDLYACSGNGITKIAPHTTAMIGTGLAAAVPEGTDPRDNGIRLAASAGTRKSAAGGRECHDAESLADRSAEAL